MPLVFRNKYSGTGKNRTVQKDFSPTSYTRSGFAKYQAERKSSASTQKKDSPKQSLSFLQRIIAPTVKKKGDVIFKEAMDNIGAVKQNDFGEISYNLDVSKDLKGTPFQGAKVTIGQPQYFKQVEFDDTPYNLGMPTLLTEKERVQRENKKILNPSMEGQEGMIRGFYSTYQPGRKLNIFDGIASLMGKFR